MKHKAIQFFRDLNLATQAAAFIGIIVKFQQISFDLARLNKDGLQGPPDGLKALDYE